MATDTWFHYAFTLAGGTSTLYVNGVAVATLEIPFSTPSGSSAYLGAFPDAPLTTEWLTGAVDEASVYARALDPSEILAIYEAGSSGKCK